MRSAIVTGANGFLGKQLTMSLVGNGYNVFAMDLDFSEDLLSSEQVKCVNIMEMPHNEIVDCLSKVGHLAFFHFAWAGTSGASRASYDTQLRNVSLTCEYVKLCMEIGCKRFIYASSINEMETYEYLQSDNIEPSGGYIYGAGKLAAHLMGETYAKQLGIDFIPVIITNIFGAGEHSQRMIYTSILKLLNNQHCSFTAGDQTYDFIYISDAINAIISVAEKGLAYNRYYIGSGNPRPLKEFLNTMRDIVAPGVRIGLGDIPFYGKDISYDQFDLHKVERDTGYVNMISFEDGIRLTADYIRRDLNGSKI